MTLIEIVSVMAIMAILAVITAAALTSYRVRMKAKRAEGDLQVIQVGLETYRARFGDYPRLPTTAIEGLSTDNAYLLNALNGRFGPAHDPIDVPSMLNNAVLTFKKPELGLPLSGLVDNEIVDPWGKPYVYNDEPMRGEDELFGYRLYSLGPDGEDGTEDDIEAE